MRKRIFEIIEVANDNDKVSNAYDIIMMISIILSLIPLAFKNNNLVFKWIDYITVSIFILDYILRLITADYKINKHLMSFILYPFTPMAIIDILSIIPSLTAVNNGLKLFRLLRLLRTLRVLKALKLLRYSKSFEIIAHVYKKQKKVLCAVATMAFAYIMVSALTIFNVEPQSFNTFFDAVYWATISLTTMGYGDIYPITEIGRSITMISSILGIAIIALPSGIIAAGYLDEIKTISNDKEN